MNVKQHWIRAFLALTMVGGFIAAMAALFQQPIPVDNKDLLTYMLGQLSGFVGAIVAFDFGSSRASEHKTELLAQPSPEPQPVEVKNAPSDPVPMTPIPDPIFEQYPPEKSK